MPVFVSPWTWRCALRDHGPSNSSLLLTAYTIGTYMNREGFAYPGQKEIAKGIRASMKSVQRHIAQLEDTGWLHISTGGRQGKAWRHYVYRACVPGSVSLEAAHKEISENY